MASPKTRRRTKKKERVEAQGKAHIKATFQNTIISLTDSYGNVISWATAGKSGFKGSRKNTPFAAQIAAEGAAKEAMELGLSKVEVEVKDSVSQLIGDIRSKVNQLIEEGRDVAEDKKQEILAAIESGKRVLEEQKDKLQRK